MKPSGPIARRTPLRAKGGRRFPRRHNPKFWRWLGRIAKSGDARCELEGAECDYWPLDYGHPVRAHIKGRGAGGYDIGGVCLLCERHHKLLDSHKLPPDVVAFLWGRAGRWVEMFEKSRAAI